MRVALFAFLALVSSPAFPHDAIPTAAKPLGWSYPYSCCSDYDCRRVGDNAPLPEAAKGDGVFVTETVEGYVINTTKEVIPHSDGRIKESPDGYFHWCSSGGAVTGRTLCLFVPPRAF